MKEVYKFNEALKVLGITPNEFNDLIASQQLIPVRHQGSLKFKKTDIERMLNPQAAPPKTEEKFYSWDKALTILQLEDEDLRGLVESGSIPITSNMKFHCADIDKWIDIKSTDATILLPEISRHSTSSSNSSPASKPVQKNPSAQYSKDEVMNVLQLNNLEELDALLNKGTLPVYYEQGEMKFEKIAVDAYRSQIQFDSTIVVPSGTLFPIENDDDLVHLKSPSTQQSKPKEKFYSWDKALTMLQIEDEDLRDLVEDGDISMTSDRKFHCADIDKWIEIKSTDETIFLG